MLKKKKKPEEVTTDEAATAEHDARNEAHVDALEQEPRDREGPLSGHPAIVGDGVLVLDTPAAVVEALGAPVGPPGVDAAATALAMLEQPAVPLAVVKLEQREMTEAEQIATHGHVLK